jgi:thiol-disulfide isomerase/thioredoxin
MPPLTHWPERGRRRWRGTMAVMRRPGPQLTARVALALSLVMTTGGSAVAQTSPPLPQSTEPASATPGSSAAPAHPDDSSAAPARPEWFGFEMTDVQTGETFTIDDYTGKVVLLETMAIWCPTCRAQGDEITKLHELLGDPEDLISISLDTDMGEDAAMLSQYVEALGYDWHFAVAPLLVARALGNLYSAEYLNPPLSPMLVIDRDGQVYGLPYGLKSAEALRDVVIPFLEAGTG